LEGLLARHLPLGTFVDQLSSVKTMAEEELSAAVNLFISEVHAVVSAGLKELKDSVLAASRAGSDVQEHINPKFSYYGASVGKFATLDDFYKGPQELIGTPNPKIFAGMEDEHCFRGNANNQFTAGNYNVTTTPKLEWEFVVSPRTGFEYPHTPEDTKLWLPGNDWKGKVGRAPKDLRVFLEKPEVNLAGLLREEVIGLRLYTGPMFVLYNAVLRGFPERDLEWLKDGDGKENRYETTIFTVASGIAKLSKVSNIPKDRRLYRGLGGMNLPRQFWEHSPECQVTFTIAAVSDAASAVLEKLKGTAEAKPLQSLRQAAAEDKAPLHGHTAEANSHPNLKTIFVASASTEYLPLELAVESGVIRSRLGVRVVKKAKQEAGVVRMSVAVPLSKGHFMKVLEANFKKAIIELCGGEHEVKIEAVADKPADFRGGGAS
jgi:hypothetical protein